MEKYTWYTLHGAPFSWWSQGENATLGDNTEVVMQDSTPLV
jgi:hypothetical protein